MTRVVCVSDLHLSDQFVGASAYDWFSDFLDAIYESDDTDHLLVCGDVNGKSANPQSGSDLADFRDLVKYYGFDTNRKVTVIPGNHDYVRAGFLDRTQSRHQYAERIKPFLKGRRSGRAFPTYQLLDHVAIVGLDTIAPTSFPKLHLGTVGADQLADLERILALASVRKRQVVLAMHHGPYGILHRHLTDHDDLWDIVDASNVDLIVCGHDHESYEDEINGVPIACVGGFMHGDGHALVVDVDSPKGIDWGWWKPDHW